MKAYPVPMFINGLSGLSGREMWEDDKRSDHPKTGPTEGNIQKMRDFIKQNVKSYARLIEAEDQLCVTNMKYAR